MKAALQKSQRSVVQGEIKEFEDSEKKSGSVFSPEKEAVSSPATVRVRNPATAQLWAAPFAAIEQTSLLSEALRVQQAAQWLLQCPSETLRKLQQRVLCACKSHFAAIAGIPLPLQPYFDLGEATSGNSEMVTGENAILAPPTPISFATFLSEFVLVHPHRRGDPAEVDPSDRLVDVAVIGGPSGETTYSRLYIRAVLPTGCPRPVAWQAAANLVYSALLAEDVLCYKVTTLATEEEIDADRMTLGLAEDHNAPSAPPRKERRKQRMDYIEEDQPLMSEVAAWTRFFSTFFDEALEGMCRDPISLFAAVLLSCALRGVQDAAASPSEGVVGHMGAHVRTVRPATRHATCTACGEQLASQEVPARRRPADRPTCIRYFLGTAAVALWVETFLQLNRITTSTAADPDEDVNQDDTVPPGEVYFIRDWLWQVARHEERCFDNQLEMSTMRIPLSCATRCRFLGVVFSAEVVEKCIARITAWADECIAQSVSLSVRQLLSILKEDLPLYPYYLTFFSE